MKRSAAAAISAASQFSSTSGEFVAGVARQQVALAAIGAQALGEAGDHLIGDVIAIGAVQHEQIVDADQQRGERLVALGRLLVENSRSARAGWRGSARRSAGRSATARRAGAPAGTIGDDAHQAMRARGLAVRPGEPASGVLDPDRRVARTVGRDQPVADLERHAHALVVDGGARDGLIARAFAVVRQAFGESAAGLDRCR